MRLTLICHASTRAVRQAVFPEDEPLDAIGEAKARALAGLLHPADQVWSSPAQRARQTAQALKLDAKLEPLLADCDYGRWSGQRLADIQTDEPDATFAWLSDPSAAPHGGESIHSLLQRVAGWLDGLDANADHIIAVTHAAVIRAAVIHALGAGAEAFWRIDVNPLSLTDLRRSHGRWTLRATGVEVAQRDD
jgi:broad specificity phosphatase PhoE